MRPWLEAGKNTLCRSLVVVPTRGHAQSLKQRCVEEKVALLGVEFLTPSLARKKRGSLPGIGKNLQLLVLRDRIESRLALLAPDDPARGTWMSLESDLEAAHADFEELLRAGFNASVFSRPELSAVFGELEDWVKAHDYVLGPAQDRLEATTAPDAEAPIADRLLILAGGAEGWPDFFGLVAVARRCASVKVAVSVPEFEGRSEAGETWVSQWEKALGAEKQGPDAGEPHASCLGVAELWGGEGGSGEKADVLLGATKADETECVALEIARLLAAGSTRVAVVFNGAGPAHSRLVRLLARRSIEFTDLVGVPGTPTAEIRMQRAIADFYGRGCRMEELLLLWPLLHEQSRANLKLGEARSVCEWLFDEVQSHSLEEHVGLLEASKDEKRREVARVARLLLPGWPERLTPEDALGRFDAVRSKLGLDEPPGWPALREFARRSPEPMSAKALLEAIRSFLPEQGPSALSAAKGQFTRVTITTPRRASGLAWSDCIFAESNLGVWPVRRESSCWLSDETRTELGSKDRIVALRLPTGDERSSLERALYCSIARDTRGRVVFSASLSDEEDPELKLVPNPWLERVLWSKGLLTEKGGSGAFGGVPSFSAAGEVPVPDAAVSAWHEIWRRRRDPSAPFDEFFLSDPSGAFAPTRLSASQIQSGIEDPASLWFASVLGVRRVGWQPFARARGKAVGVAVHRALAVAVGGASADGAFSPMPAREQVAERMALELAHQRERRPKDRYWESFHMDVERAAARLLGWIFALPTMPLGAAEVRLPEGATVPVGKGRRIGVIGKMDLVLSTLPRWSGARMEVVDYKTGGDSALSAKSMASRGASLQLGVYLEAARSLGATGSVWMLKPEDRPKNLPMDAMEAACAKLVVIGDHVATGIYGALTVDRTDYSHGFEWPLACAAIPEGVLRSKFAATFGADEPQDLGDDDE
ncbi:MAG TPA: PD-(D/E)XK nuclease family protein [Opitutaceae bacterium]|nr:PD-(D/E)XK nuclease family protein [Opitutaceae bacterium]